MYRAVVFDVDGVFTYVKSIWRYVHSSLGLLKEAEKNMRLFFDGKISYEEWAVLDARLWRGIPQSRFMEIIESVPMRPGLERLKELLDRHKLKVVAISGGILPMVEAVSRLIGFDLIYASRLKVKDGVLTGEIEVEVTHENKGELLKRACSSLGIPAESCIAVGDGDVDIPMFRAAGFSIAFNPHSTNVMKAADVSVFSDSLDALANVLESVLSAH